MSNVKALPWGSATVSVTKHIHIALLLKRCHHVAVPFEKIPPCRNAAQMNQFMKLPAVLWHTLHLNECLSRPFSAIFRTEMPLDTGMHSMRSASTCPLLPLQVLPVLQAVLQPSFYFSFWVIRAAVVKNWTFHKRTPHFLLPHSKIHPPTKFV